VAGLVSWERVESALLGFVKEDIDSEICNQMGGPLIDALANASAAAYDLLEPHVQRSLDQNITRGSRMVEAEADMEAKAAAQNKTLVVMTTDSPSPPLAVEEELGFLGFRQTAPQPTAHERRFSLRPFLDVLRTIVSLAAGAIVAAGELSVNVTALGANASIFDLGAVGDARVLLGFEQLTISGLETLRVVEEMAVVGPYTLRHGFELDSLRIELDLSVGIEDAVAVGEPPPFDAFSVSLGLADLEIELDTLVALSEDALTTLQIGSIARSPTGCLLDAVFGVAIPSLALRVGDIAFPRVQGLINARITQVASTVFDTVEAVWEPALIAAMPSVVEELGLGPANEAISRLLEQPARTPAACPAVQTPAVLGEPELINFSCRLPAMARSALCAPGAELLIAQALAAVNGLVEDGEDGLSAVSGLLRDALPVAGTPLVHVEGVAVEMPFEFYAIAHTIELVALNVSVSNLDTVNGVSLEPSGPQTLASTGTIGLDRRPVALSLYAEVRLYEPAGPVLIGPDLKESRVRGDNFTTEALKISVAASHITLFLELLLRIDAHKLASVYASEALYWQCWLASVAPGGLRLADFRATLGSLDVFDIECLQCDSDFFSTLAANARAPASRQGMERFLQGLLDRLGHTVTNDRIAALIDGVLAVAPEQCATLSAGATPPPAFRGYETPLCEEGIYPELPDLLRDWAASVPWWHWALVSATAVAALVAHLCWRRGRYRRCQRAAHSLDLDDPLILAQHVARTSSLARSTAVPCCMRYGVPLVLVCNAALFLTGHLAVGATVDILIDAGSETIALDAYFTFSIAQSTIDMYNAGAKFLAWVVVVFSGAWPYVKLGVMCGLWVTPPWLVCLENRGAAFAWLDFLGKWSMIDIFVMIISVVGFNLALEPPAELEFLMGDLYRVHLFVTPRYGLYANMFAQFVSQISSHVCLHYHRAHLTHLADLRAAVLAGRPSHQPPASKPASRRTSVALSDRHSSAGRHGASAIAPAKGDGGATEGTAAEPRQRLAGHPYSVGSTGRRFAVVTRLYLAALAALLLALMPLVVVGSYLPALRYEYNGVVGMLVEAHEAGSRVRTYSVFELARFLADQANGMWQPDAGSALGVFGMYTVVATLVLCTVVAPILQCATLLVLHFAPLTRSGQRRAYVTAEAISAWSYQEVFIIAVGLGISQIESISRFLVACYCNDLMPMFAALADAGALDKQYAECFYISADFEVGLVMLFGSGVLLSLATQVMMRTARTAFSQQRQREESARPPRPCLRYWMLPGYTALRWLCTRRLDIVDQDSDKSLQVAAARAAGSPPPCAPPALQLGPWRLLYERRRGLAVYLHAVSGELRSAADMTRQLSVELRQTLTVDELRDASGGD